MIKRAVLSGKYCTLLKEQNDINISLVGPLHPAVYFFSINDQPPLRKSQL